jgi:hypothetical protein
MIEARQKAAAARAAASQVPDSRIARGSITELVKDVATVERLGYGVVICRDYCAVDRADQLVFKVFMTLDTKRSTEALPEHTIAGGELGNNPTHEYIACISNSLRSEGLYLANATHEKKSLWVEMIGDVYKETKPTALE